MKLDNLVAIDVHTHAEVSCHTVWQPYDEAASKYFKVSKRSTIAETVAGTVRLIGNRGPKDHNRNKLTRRLSLGSTLALPNRETGAGFGGRSDGVE